MGRRDLAPESILRLEEDAVVFLDQRRLPDEEVEIRCASAEDVAEAIRTMVVRGAPALGIAAAYGYALAAARGEDLDEAFAVLLESRPTAANIGWALAVMRDDPSAERARELHREEVERCRRMAAHAAALLEPGTRALTHCNAGALATAGDYGTALGVVRGARDAGKRVAVIADETRPFLQGARLTAWELAKDSIPVTVITDNMAGHVMKQGKVDAVVVGADRIAANGDTANKIGTYMVAVLARQHDIPFYVAAPISTIDLAVPSGEHIPIEERDAREVTHIRDLRLAPEGVAVHNPAFDVTPHDLIAAIITDKGVARPPYTASLRVMIES